MHGISEVDRRSACGQFDNSPFWCENVNLIREEIGFNALNKFKRAAGALLMYFCLKIPLDKSSLI